MLVCSVAHSVRNCLAVIWQDWHIVAQATAELTFLSFVSKYLFSRPHNFYNIRQMCLSDSRLRDAAEKRVVAYLFSVPKSGHDSICAVFGVDLQNPNTTGDASANYCLLRMRKMIGLPLLQQF